MGGILTLPIFLAQFPDINDGEEGISSSLKSTRSTNQGIAIASYNLGCFIGAVITIFIGNPLGRRKMIFLGTAIMVIGAALQASAFSLEYFIIARILTVTAGVCIMTSQGLPEISSKGNPEISQGNPREESICDFPSIPWEAMAGISITTSQGLPDNIFQRKSIIIIKNS